MPKETFKTRVISNNRVTIPEESVEILKIKEGEIVEVSIKTIEKTK